MRTGMLVGLALSWPAFLPGVVAAQAAPAAPAPARDGAAAAAPSSPWFTWGADVRFRNDSVENPSLTRADPPGHQVAFERLRLRAWGGVRPAEAVGLDLRLAWEGRHYWTPASRDTWEPSEIVFDTVAVKLAPPGLGLTLVVGRQDLVLGDGWLVSDGTPLDGPRTSFFDAGRVTIALRGLEGTLELVYLDQRADPDARLRPLYSTGQPLMEQDERGAIAYLAAKPLAHTRTEAYLIHKHDAPVAPRGDRGDVFTFGGNLSQELGEHAGARLEGAYQLGHRENAALFPGVGGALSAWGSNGRLWWAFRDPREHRSWLGYEVLSGNGPHDTRNHQFDPLWGRWARYSELFPGDLDRPGDRSNVVRLNLGHELEPVKGMHLQANYHALFAYANRKAGTAGFSERGRFRGHLVTALLTHASDRAWSAKLLVEGFWPGGYYQAAAGPLEARTAPAAFVRAEVSCRL